MMTCEKCGKRYDERFLIPHEVWAALVSPTGDDRGYFCLMCTDAILRGKGWGVMWFGGLILKDGGI